MKNQKKLLASNGKGKEIEVPLYLAESDTIYQSESTEVLAMTLVYSFKAPEDVIKGSKTGESTDV